MTPLGLAEQRVELATGVTVGYVDQGPPERTAMLGLPGWPDPWQSFELVLAALPADVRSLALSWRGCGNSDRPPSGYESSALAADVVAFLDATGIDTAVLVGHSLGALVAQRVAIDDPERVAGLGLIGAFATLQGTDAIGGLKGIVAELEDPIDPSRAREFAIGVTARPVPTEFLDRIVTETLKAPAFVWRAGLSGVLGVDHTAELAHIAAPVLLLWGDQDQLVDRATQEALAAAIPGARRVDYPGVGHSPNWEVPDLVAADVLSLRAAAPGDGQ